MVSENNFCSAELCKEYYHDHDFITIVKFNPYITQMIEGWQKEMRHYYFDQNKRRWKSYKECTKL